MIDKKLKKLTAKKQRLDKHRSLPQEQVKSLNEWLDIELTYTSNAIEGSTLTRSETALVVEKGITVKGKTLKEHLEATNHIKGIQLVRSLGKKSHRFITEKDIKDIHKIVVAGIIDAWAGKYRQISVFVRGAPVEPPPPNEVPHRMKKLVEWLRSEQGEHPVKVAAELHYRFVKIHPFIDGNGRTARLLMNLVLIQNGYPVAIIRTGEREDYIDSINKGTATGDLDDFYSVIISAVERSLDAHLALMKGKSIIPYFIEKRRPVEENLLQIGKVASLANVPIPTVRFYISQGLIKPEKKSKGGFMLFSPNVVETIREIKILQKDERLTLREIKKRLKKRSDKLIF